MIELLEKKSKFLTYSFLIKTEQDVKIALSNLKQEHKKATHICYAYNLFGKSKFSDDGEPAGTAGKPILNVILKNNLTNTLIVVVRYFGGIKLGAGGLTRMYGECAKQSVEQEPIKNLMFCKSISFKTTFNMKKVIDNLSHLEYVKKIEYAFGEQLNVLMLVLTENLNSIISILINDIKINKNDLIIADEYC